MIPLCINACLACPLDLLSDSFYPSRQAVIDERLTLVSSGDIKELLLTSYTANHGTACTGISWNSYSLQHLYKVCKAVGGPALAVIFKIFAEDYRGSHSGMPDLVLWRDVGGVEEHLLVEVKSARDRLSDAQRHWAWIFGQHNVNMLVCKVKHN